MRFDHIVKHNGKYYKIGEDVPESSSIPILTDDVPDGALNTNDDGSVNAYDSDNNFVGTIDAKNVEKSQEEAGEHFTKTEINRMSVDDLKILAPTLGIEVTEESTGAKIKEEIIEKLGL